MFLHSYSLIIHYFLPKIMIGIKYFCLLEVFLQKPELLCFISPNMFLFYSLPWMGKLYLLQLALCYHPLIFNVNFCLFNFQQCP